MKNQKSHKLCGKEFDFRLEVSDYGFVLWVDKRDTHSVWLLDASTIADDGTFRVGEPNKMFNYGFFVKMEKLEFSNKFEFTLIKPGDSDEQTQMGLEVNSGQE